MRDFSAFSQTARAFSLLGNHEHAHVGGPVVSKFYRDEAAVLNAALAEDRERMVDFIATWPLIAVAGCGLAFVHGSPAATMASLADWEKVDYRGYEGMMPLDMLRQAGPFETVLWARSATEKEATAFLAATLPECTGRGVGVFGHDVVRSGHAKIGTHQLCLSTSYGLYDEDKTYLRVDLSKRYDTVDTLRVGVELLPLYSTSAAAG